MTEDEGGGAWRISPPAYTTPMITEVNKGREAVVTVGGTEVGLCKHVLGGSPGTCVTYQRASRDVHDVCQVLKSLQGHV